MIQINKELILTKEEYYETHLSIINCVLPVKLTIMEIKVLALFMSLTGDIADDRFGASAKKIIKDKLGISSAGLSNYLRSFKDKGFIRVIGEETVILPLLFPESENQKYYFNLINAG